MGARPVRRKPQAVPRPQKAAFPSSRQKRCKGLKKSIYPDYVREMVDYDYLNKLSEEERVWLSAFSEEYYKGWRMKDETQVQPLEQLRSSNAAYKRLRLSGDPLAFPGHRHPQRVESHSDRPVAAGDTDGPTTSNTSAAVVAAGSRGIDLHELRGRNLTEEEMVKWLDRPVVGQLEIRLDDQPLAVPISLG